MALSAKAKMEISRHEKHAAFPYLIKIDHEDYGVFYYANASENITYNGQVYLASTFSINPPDQDGSNIGNASITISDVQQFWVQKIRNTNKTAQIHFIAGIRYDNGGVPHFEAIEENTFTLRLATYNGVIVTWDMEFDLVMMMVLNAISCTAVIAPGCA